MGKTYFVLPTPANLNALHRVGTKCVPTLLNLKKIVGIEQSIYRNFFIFVSSVANRDFQMAPDALLLELDARLLRQAPPMRNFGVDELPERLRRAAHGLAGIVDDTLANIG